MPQNPDPAEVNDRHQRVERFNAQKLVIFVDAACVHDVAHVSLPPWLFWFIV